MWSRNSRQNICGDLGYDAQMRLERGKSAVDGKEWKIVT